MKYRAHISAAIYILNINIFATLSLSAAVPLKWTVETSRVQPAVFDVVHGESIELEAAMQSYGNPLSMAGKPVFIFWQTNGMNTAWWSAPAQVRTASALAGGAATTNVLAATFTPEMDPWAPTVTGFIGATGDIYRAAFTLRFRKGPGATPNLIEHPPRILDLAHTTVINPPWPTQQDFAKTTTVMKAELKGYIDSEIESAGLVTPESVKNAAGTIVSNVVTKAYVQGLGISGSVTSVNGQTGTVVISSINHAVEADSASSSEKSSCIEVSRRLPNTGIGGSGVGGRNVIDTMTLGLNLRPVVTRYQGTTKLLEEGVAYQSDITSIQPGDIGAVPTSRTINGQPLTSDITIQAGVTSVNSQTGEVTITAASIGAATESSLSDKADSSTVAQLNLQVQALGANANAEDARVIVTNYNSATKMPEAQFDVKVSNSWITVWHEMTRWNWFLGGFTTYTNGVASTLANKGEKEWGWFDSATGNPSPDGILQLSQPRIQVCSGAAYQRYVSTTGSVWVLESNGLVADINGTTNGYFRITDEEGNAHFEIVKGDKQSLFATAKTMTQQQMGVTHYFTTYAITNAVTTPVAQFSRSLNPATWIKETDSGCPCNVSWTNNGDNSWTVEWWPIGNEPVLFMMAGYEKGGETYIRNVVPVKMQYIYLGNTKYLLGTATISGHTVLTLTAQ